MTVELKQAIGFRVKRARENAGLTQERLAELVDRTKDAISSIERGINFPALDTLYKISESTNMPVSLMLESSQRSRRFSDIKTDIDTLLFGMSDDDAQICLSLIEVISKKINKSSHSA